MTQINTPENLVQVTQSRPEGWSLQELLIRGFVVFITIAVVILGILLTIALALRPTDCCFNQSGQTCTSPEGCYCFGRDVSIGENGGYVGNIRNCPVGGPELCTLDTACYLPPELFSLWGSRDRAFYVNTSGQRLPCTEVVGAINP